VDSPTQEEFEAVKNGIKARMHTQAESPSVAPLPIRANEDIPAGKVSFWRRYYPVAATLALALLMSALYFWLVPATEEVVYQTEFGKTRTVVLPDHSVVTLNANSTLKFTSPWKENQPREVWVSGEAFFQVRKKLIRTGRAVQSYGKFIVHSGPVDVQVLGTQFNVHNRPGRVNVVLTSGKVELRETDQDQPGVLMSPGELVEVSGKGQFNVRRKVDTHRFTAWRNHQLIFDETPIAEVAQTIEDYFGIPVKCEDSLLAGKKFTGAVPSGNLKVLLTVLSESFDLEITQQNNVIMIKSKQK
jgi:ferric-dicitrate binding protein FerR (iron transport regulator)